MAIVKKSAKVQNTEKHEELKTKLLVHFPYLTSEFSGNEHHFNDYYIKKYEKWWVFCRTVNFNVFRLYVSNSYNGDWYTTLDLYDHSYLPKLQEVFPTDEVIIELK